MLRLSKRSSKKRMRMVVRCNSWSNSHKATQNLTGKMKRMKRKIKIGDIATHSKCQIHIDEIGQHSHSPHSSRSMISTNPTTHQHQHTPLFASLSTQNPKKRNSHSPNSACPLPTHHPTPSTRDEMSTNSEEESPSTTLPTPHSLPTLDDGSETDLNTATLKSTLLLLLLTTKTTKRRSS
jgi:hypothetical protein